MGQARSKPNREKRYTHITNLEAVSLIPAVLKIERASSLVRKDRDGCTTVTLLIVIHRALQWTHVHKR